jgi:hypothetical protein
VSTYSLCSLSAELTSFNATDRNEHLILLLRDLSVRVDEGDRLRIENALNNEVSGHFGTGQLSKRSSIKAHPALESSACYQLRAKKTGLSHESTLSLSRLPVRKETPPYDPCYFRS